MPAGTELIELDGRSADTPELARIAEGDVCTAD